MLHGPSIFNTVDWVPVAHNNYDTKPIPPVSSSWQDPNTEIYVGIVSYRDKRCSSTIANLFANAKHPERVRVGVVEQFHTESDQFNCVRDYCNAHRNSARVCPYESQIVTTVLTHNDARGPNYARYMQQNMMSHEEFCMQTDAHAEFIRNWDDVLMNMWAMTENEYAILSAPPVDISVLHQLHLNENTEEYEQVVPHLCQAKFNSRGAVVSLPPTAATGLRAPILSPLYSAGFSFSKCHAELKVPNDPNLQMIFEADEFVKFARYWTRGYDVYTPHQVVGAHDYYNKLPGAPSPADAMEWSSKNHKDIQRALYDRSMARIRTILGYSTDNSNDNNMDSLNVVTRYGLGTVRSLDQFIEFTGIDTRESKVFGDRCMELKWVPYADYETDPRFDTGDAWGGAAEILPLDGMNIPLAVESASKLSASGVGVDIDSYPEDAFANAYRDMLQYSSFSRDSSNSENKQQQHNSKEPADAADMASSIDVVGGNLRADSIAAAAAAADLGSLPDIHRHIGSELWWIFQPIDTAIESIINEIDYEMGAGHGKKVMKVLLLLFPFAMAIVGTAIWALTSGNKNRIFDSDLKKI